MLTVKQVSEIMGISGHALRYYDKEGLFPKLHRDRQNRRIFSELDIGYLQMIQELRDMGMPIAEVRRYIRAADDSGNEALKERQRLVQKQMEKIQDQLAHVLHQLEMLQSKAAYYEAVVGDKIVDNWMSCVNMPVEAKIKNASGSGRAAA